MADQAYVKIELNPAFSFGGDRAFLAVRLRDRAVEDIRTMQTANDGASAQLFQLALSSRYFGFMGTDGADSVLIVMGA